MGRGSYKIKDVGLFDHLFDDITEEYKEDNAKQKAEDIHVNRGDIYQLGDHFLMCGDSTTSDISILLNGAVPDLVFADPPYGMKKQNRGVLNDNMNNDDLIDFNKKWMQIAFEHLKDQGGFYVWGTDRSLMNIFADIIRPIEKGEKGHLLNLITWDKYDNAQGKNSKTLKRYPIGDEKCLFFVKGFSSRTSSMNASVNNSYKGYAPIKEYLNEERKKAGLTVKQIENKTTKHAQHYFRNNYWAFPRYEHYKTMQEMTNRKYFTRSYNELRKEYEEIKEKHNNTTMYFNNTHENMTQVWNFKMARFTDYKSSKRNELHATPKPINLCIRALRSSLRTGEIVLDPFGGSGSTLIAAQRCGRKCYMMELQEKYVSVIIRRFEEETGIKAKLVRSETVSDRGVGGLNL